MHIDIEFYLVALSSLLPLLSPLYLLCLFFTAVRVAKEMLLEDNKDIFYSILLINLAAKSYKPTEALRGK